MLVSLLLVECTARPTVARSIEWLISWWLRSGILGSTAVGRARAMTLGPLQVRSTSFARHAVVQEALANLGCLRGMHCDAELLAGHWNGSPGGRPRPDYVEALVYAERYASALLTN